MSPTMKHIGAIASELHDGNFEVLAQWLSGLGGDEEEPQLPEIREDLARRKPIQSCAHRILQAQRERVTPSESDIAALVAYILERPEVRLALQVREGGPWALSSAVELAQLILAGPFARALLDLDEEMYSDVVQK